MIRTFAGVFVVACCLGMLLGTTRLHADDAAAPAAATDTDKATPHVIIDTTLGAIELELYPDKAPITVTNFLAYVDVKFFDSTVFHRVIPGFMVQGGGFTSTLQEKSTNDPIKNEAGNGLSNDRGTIAMARTPVVNSATAQFFINVKDNANLNHRDNSNSGFGYCVFGKVVAGMEVVDKIVAVPTGVQRSPANGPMENVPNTPVIIKSIRRK